MMDLSQPDQFDLDRLAEDLGALPHAPLAMPVQRLEPEARSSRLSDILPRLVRLRKVGH